MFDLVLTPKHGELQKNRQRTSRAYLVSLGDGVLDTCCRLHVVRHGLIHSWGWSRGQDTMLESLSVASEAPLLGRKNRFLILQSPLHYELILIRAERPGDKEHMDLISHWQIFVKLSENIKSFSFNNLLGNIWQSFFSPQLRIYGYTQCQLSTSVVWRRRRIITWLLTIQPMKHLMLLAAQRCLRVYRGQLLVLIH